jgi:hypothetical protein
MTLHDLNGSGETAVDVPHLRTLVCPDHERALGEDPSVNAAIFPIEVLNATMRDERTWLALGWDKDGHKAEPDLDKMAAWLAKVAPACEWIAPGALNTAWQRAKVLGPAPHRNHQPPAPPR